MAKSEIKIKDTRREGYSSLILNVIIVHMPLEAYVNIHSTY